MFLWIRFADKRRDAHLHAYTRPSIWYLFAAVAAVDSSKGETGEAERKERKWEVPEKKEEGIHSETKLLIPDVSVLAFIAKILASVIKHIKAACLATSQFPKDPAIVEAVKYTKTFREYIKRIRRVLAFYEGRMKTNKGELETTTLPLSKVE